MTDAHLHLILNHFPIISTIFGLLLLLIGLLLQNITLRRTALAMFIFGALTAIPTYITGEGAEEIVEHLPNISHDIIHEHEEEAEVFIWIISALGVLAAVTLFADLKKKGMSKILSWITLLLAIGTAIMSVDVGTSGGEISHPEVRNEQGSAGEEFHSAEEH
ncbi:MAG: hypothetical protein LPJ89_11135 [Hymenobacteraceae bacterium]|nr:hypothetical protein [Hymenobacteraceae bacterium]MDX5397931.1 hypothetical protein [Hymenobacteraceae bacterium]MDX5444322.1 hypothetical protein [Hymenobacteraceae bacterium]MDX5514000.1 hypothetical protein [Hymenobacteraceae bacterium]